MFWLGLLAKAWAAPTLRPVKFRSILFLLSLLALFVGLLGLPVACAFGAPCHDTESSGECETLEREIAESVEGRVRLRALQPLPLRRAPRALKGGPCQGEPRGVIPRLDSWLMPLRC